MTQQPTGTKRRYLAAGLAAVVTLAGVGVAVAGPGGAPDSPPAALAAADPRGDVSVSPPEWRAPEIEMPVPSAPEVGAEAVVPADPPSKARSTMSPVAGKPSPSQPVSSQSSSSSGTLAAPLTTSTTIDVSKFLSEMSANDDQRGAGIESEGLAAELESEVRACVATLLDEIGASFDGTQPDAEQIQSLASDVVDDVLACVAGLVDVNQVLNCVSGVIEEILAVVMTMDLADLPELVTEIADDVVRCISA